MPDYISNTRRNGLLGLLSDALGSVDQYAQRPDNTMPMGKANPVLSLLSNTLVQPMQRTFDKASYGEPITNYGKANVPLIPQDTADTVATLLGLGAAVPRSVNALRPVAQAAVRNALVPSDMARQGQRGVAAVPRGLLDSAPMSKPVDYAIEHRPMNVDGGASLLHDLESSFGPDVYGKQALQYFGSGDPREKTTLKIMNQVRGNPDAKVTIYRGVPDGVGSINPGDWVTLDPNVAADYGNVVKMQVPASHITSWPDSLLEFGYYPSK